MEITPEIQAIILAYNRQKKAENARRYFQADPERVRRQAERMKKYYLDTREERIQKQKKWISNNHDNILARQRARRALFYEFRRLANIVID